MDFEQDIQQCLSVLHAGGLILYPTDTIWGIGCDATNAAAVQRVYKLKQREESRSMIVLVPGKGEVLKYVSAPDLAIFDFLETVQRPTTVIYPGAIGLATNLIGPDGSIAIRIVQELFCRHLLKRFRKPIVSTSANISGERSPGSFAAVDERIKGGVDYIVRYRQEEQTLLNPSTIIKWENGVQTVIRS